MKESLEQALNNVELVYNDIKDIANDLLNEYTSDITSLITYISDHIENLTNDDLRKLILKLSVKAYSFGDIKEKASIKAEIAEMLKKEKYAKEFALAEGTVVARDNQVILKISDEVVTQAIYDLTASLYKVKLDEVRRMIDSLKTVLTSRLSEAKLTATLNEGMEEYK
jgi:hypothetical protein